jgi:hypothetical protein
LASVFVTHSHLHFAQVHQLSLSPRTQFAHTGAGLPRRSPNTTLLQHTLISTLNNAQKKGYTLALADY